jgi:hypothetical protein
MLKKSEPLSESVESEASIHDVMGGVESNAMQSYAGRISLVDNMGSSLAGSQNKLTSVIKSSKGISE